MIGAVTLSSVTPRAPKKCLFLRSTMTRLCSQVSRTNGPLQTMLAASVHRSPCFSTDGRWAGKAAMYAESTGKYPRGPSSVTSSVQSPLATTPTCEASGTLPLLKGSAPLMS